MARDFGEAVNALRAARTATPGSSSHVASVEAQLDAIAKGDFAAAVANAHEDVELEILAPPEFQFVRRAQGKAALREAMATNFNSLEQQRPEINTVVSQADTLVLIGKESGFLRGSGAPYNIEFVHRFTFKDGKLASIRIISATSQN